MMNTLSLALIIRVAAGVFLAVLGVVTMVKIIQIAEDLRYIRSKQDTSVQRPRTWKNTLIVCIIASLIIVLVAVGYMISYSSGASGMKLL